MSILPTQILSDEIERTAIDPSGQLGSLYDGCQDRLVGQLGVDDQDKFDQSVREINGEIINGDDDQPQNLLRRLPINEQLRLSILLNLTPCGSITSLIDYPHLINAHTRFLHYSAVNRVQKLNEPFIRLSVPSTSATHIITEVRCGIDFVVVLQLPTDASIVKDIDHVLAKLLSFLLNDSDMEYTITPEEGRCLEDIITARFYSNIPELNKLTTVRDVCRRIKDKSDPVTDQPISYTLRPMKRLYPQDDTKLTPLSIKLSERIEDYVLQLSADVTKLETSRVTDDDWKQQLLQVKDTLNNEITRIASKVIEIRSGQNENLIAEEIFNSNEQTMLQTLKDSNITKSGSEYAQDETLVPNNCADKKGPGYLKRLRSDSSGETHENITNQLAKISSPSLPNECEPFNILLLGETGVGKSTFINAFANYLTFDTLQQAETGQPVVLIPVSFLITVGDDFDEQTVKFGDVDVSNNEDFEHPGQSVTQHCRSYVFTVDRQHGKKVCIIDTPGFGDTRGINQDDYNMAHILEYIQNLSPLNAICFLLKPNEARLNIFYRSCLMQLSLFQKSRPRNNILFCFTNARSTFYTPGDTAPLLKKMLASLSQNAVPFKKENTFCFDSESFRYLVALRNGILFNDLEREEYDTSWTKSVVEARRFVRCICETLSLEST